MDIMSTEDRSGSGSGNGPAETGAGGHLHRGPSSSTPSDVDGPMVLEGWEGLESRRGRDADLPGTLLDPPPPNVLQFHMPSRPLTFRVGYAPDITEYTLSPSFIARHPRLFHCDEIASLEANGGVIPLDTEKDVFEMFTQWLETGTIIETGYEGGDGGVGEVRAVRDAQGRRQRQESAIRLFDMFDGIFQDSESKEHPESCLSHPPSSLATLIPPFTTPGMPVLRTPAHLVVLPSTRREFRPSTPTVFRAHLFARSHELGGFSDATISAIQSGFLKAKYQLKSPPIAWVAMQVLTKTPRHWGLHKLMKDLTATHYASLPSTYICSSFDPVTEYSCIVSLSEHLLGFGAENDVNSDALSKSSKSSWESAVEEVEALVQRFAWNVLFQREKDLKMWCEMEKEDARMRCGDAVWYTNEAEEGDERGEERVDWVVVGSAV